METNLSGNDPSRCRPSPSLLPASPPPELVDGKPGRRARMAAAGPSLLALSRPGTGVATMAAGRRGRGSGTVRSRQRRGGGALRGVGGAAMGLCATPAMASPDPVAPPDLAEVTTAARRWPVAPARFVGDDGFGSAAARVVGGSSFGRPAALGGERPGASCRVVLAGGSRPAAAFAGGGDGASLFSGYSISLPPVPLDPVLPFSSGCSSNALWRCGARSILLRCSSLLRLGCFQSMLRSSLGVWLLRRSRSCLSCKLGNDDPQ
uniref:Uncharacterized protein n=1 Tax=Oryza sativa subsp. japonica TaxID=39947 RepID=Q652G3_ORYSJ|nr:hypothetical protein [Oryza sativa Japonica Group]